MYITKTKLLTLILLLLSWKINLCKVGYRYLILCITSWEVWPLLHYMELGIITIKLTIACVSVVFIEAFLNESPCFFGWNYSFAVLVYSCGVNPGQE